MADAKTWGPQTDFYLVYGWGGHNPVVCEDEKEAERILTEYWGETYATQPYPPSLIRITGERRRG